MRHCGRDLFPSHLEVPLNKASTFAGWAVHLRGASARPSWHRSLEQDIADGVCADWVCMEGWGELLEPRLTSAVICALHSTAGLANLQRSSACTDLWWQGKKKLKPSGCTDPKQCFPRFWLFWRLEIAPCARPGLRWKVPGECSLTASWHLISRSYSCEAQE